MKINKTLAAGIAATLAVTSLTAVSSAVVQAWTWDMAKTYGQINWNPTVRNSANKALEPCDPGAAFDYLTYKDGEADKARNFAIKGAVENNSENGAKVNTNGDHDANWAPIVNEYDFDYYIPFLVDSDDEELDGCLESISITIQGKKLRSDGASTEDYTQTIPLIKVASLSYGEATFAAATEQHPADGVDYVAADSKLVGASKRTSEGYILPVYVNGAPADNCFLPERYVQVDKITFNVKTKGYMVTKGLSKDQYKLLKSELTDNAWDAALGFDTLDNTNTVGYHAAANAEKYDFKDKAGLQPFNDLGEVVHSWVTGYTEYLDLNGDDAFVPADDYNYGTRAAQIKISLADGFAPDANGINTRVIVYQIADAANALGDSNFRVWGKPFKYAADAGDGVLTADGKNDGMLLFSKIESILQGDLFIKFIGDASSMKTYDLFAWLPRTEDPDDGNEVMVRDEIWKLSDTADYNSSSVADLGSETVSNVQSYEVTDDKGNEGTIPKGFNGMASKFADFFNSTYGEAPKKEAKVIFKFTKPAAAADDDNWKNGGIPSTEVGLRNFLEDQDVKDFALFVNYNATTGSLQATATLKPESGEVEFDVSNILTALGGRTIGVVQDLYYGLANGASTKDDWEGLWVEEVRYEYNDDAASATDGKQDDAKQDDQKPADEKPADEKPADKEDDGVVPVPGDDKTEVPADGGNDGGSAVVDNGAKKEDKNPHTGVALAVIPAIVAGAAVVASKKRK